MWVFGYGSLIWKVDFPYEKRVPGFIKGYVRRFWQGSEDHRGTPESPGRVVTLIPRTEWEQRFAHVDPHDTEQTPDLCWGMAYKVPEDKAQEVREHLDFREQNGYDTCHVTVYRHRFDPASSGPKIDEIVVEDALLYIATTSNHMFVKEVPTKIEYLAEHIAKSKGPSGLNRDYLFGLAKALRVISPPDDPDTHIFELERLVLELKHLWVDPDHDKGSIREEDMKELEHVMLEYQKTLHVLPN